MRWTARSQRAYDNLVYTRERACARVSQPLARSAARARTTIATRASGGRVSRRRRAASVFAGVQGEQNFYLVFARL